MANSAIRENNQNSGLANFISTLKLLKSGFINSLDAWLINVFSYSQLTSVLYYALVSKEFRREQFSVLQGKRKYQHNLEKSESSQYLLRRNIHRLEKGLIMRPRRKIFAKNYITETVSAYKIAISNVTCRSSNVVVDELNWAHSVLDKYFGLIGSDIVIDQAKKEFLSLGFEPTDTHIRVPYKRDLESHPVSYEQFNTLSWKRRSVRWYLQKPVPRELIDRAVESALLSPSACNRQPFQFRIFDQPDLVEKIAAVPMGTKGFYDNFPAIIAVVGDLSAYFSERDRHIIYIDASLASMSLMYAFETLGLSSCPINWPDIENLEKEMEKLISLEPHERVVMFISVGYPDPEGLVPYSQKKCLDEIRSYN